MTHFRHRRQLLLGSGSSVAFRRHARSLRRARTKPLQVGGLPVTCNLTLPVACAASRRRRQPAPAGAGFRDSANTAAGPEIKESLMSGRLTGRLHAGAADHGSRRQRDTGQGRIRSVTARARSSWCGPILPTRTSRTSRESGSRYPAASPSTISFSRKMLAKEGMTVKDARDRRDGASRHAGRALRQSGGRLRDRRAVRGGRAARRLRAAAFA